MKGNTHLRLKALVIMAFTGILGITAGCKKTEAPDPHESVFVNQNEVPIHLRVYGSFEDYVHAGPPVWETRMEPLGKVQVPAASLPTGKTYYIDWFSEDYSIHNWFNSQGLFPTIHPNPTENFYDLSRNLRGPARLTFLHGSGNASRWRAVDKLLFSSSLGFVSYWDSATVMDKNRIVDVRKDFTATYRFVNDQLKPDSLNLNIIVYRSETAYIEFQNEVGENMGSMIGGRLPSGQAPDYTVHSTDSLLALFPDSEFYYLMVRD